MSIIHCDWCGNVDTDYDDEHPENCPREEERQGQIEDQLAEMRRNAGLNKDGMANKKDLERARLEGIAEILDGRNNMPKGIYI